MIEKIKKSKWSDLIAAIILITGALLIYYYLREEEKYGHAVRFSLKNWPAQVIYNIGGKFYISLVT